MCLLMESRSAFYAATHDGRMLANKFDAYVPDFQMENLNIFC
jgi:hypothetical protein